MMRTKRKCLTLSSGLAMWLVLYMTKGFVDQRGQRHFEPIFISSSGKSNESRGLQPGFINHSDNISLDEILPSWESQGELQHGFINPYDKGISLGEILPRVRINSTGDCAPLHFSKVPLKKTALASHPGAGNTWTRQILQQLTGIYTGDVYSILKCHCDGGSELKFHLYKRLKAMMWDGSTVATKTHEGYIGAFDPGKYDQAVVLIRSPYDSIVAEYHRVRGVRDDQGNRVTNQQNFYTEHFQGFAKSLSRSWWQFYSNWLSTNMTTYILEYDNLQTHMYQELQRIGQFVGVKEQYLHNATHLDCVARSTTYPPKRKATSFFASPYPEEIKVDIEKYIYKIKHLVRTRYAMELKLNHSHG